MNVRSDAVVCDDMSGLEGIASKRLGSRYRSGSSPDWLKLENPDAPAVKREAEEDLGQMTTGQFMSLLSLRHSGDTRRLSEPQPHSGATRAG